MTVLSLDVLLRALSAQLAVMALVCARGNGTACLLTGLLADWQCHDLLESSLKDELFQSSSMMLSELIVPRDGLRSSFASASVVVQRSDLLDLSIPLCFFLLVTMCRAACSLIVLMMLPCQGEKMPRNCMLARAAATAKAQRNLDSFSGARPFMMRSAQAERTCSTFPSALIPGMATRAAKIKGRARPKSATPTRSRAGESGQDARPPHRCDRASLRFFVLKEKVTFFLVQGLVVQHFSWMSVIWLPSASGKLMVDTKWLKLLLSASIAWTEGGEGEEGSK